jgi:O-antigen ligase
VPPERIRGIDAGAFATAAGGVVLLASDQGGFFPHSWPWAALAYAAVAALVLAGTTPLYVGRTQIVLIGGLAALTVWTVVSAIWSSEPSTSLSEATRTPIYTVAALALVGFAAAGASLALLLGVAVATTGIAAYSLVDFAVRGAHGADQQGGLLEYPLGYANALGILCAIGLVVVLTLGVAERRRARGAAAAVALAAAAVLAVALARTNSEGSLVAAVAGGGVSIAFAIGRRWSALAAAGVATALIAVYVLTAITAPGFMSARGDYWHVAWIATSHHPLIGDGAGTYDLVWATYGDVAQFGGALDAHSLYLEMPAELGIVGLLLTLVLIAPVLSGLRRAPRTPLAAAALGGAITFIVHAGLDWDWEMPAVTAAGLVCLAALSGAVRPQPAVGRTWRFAGLGVAVAAIISYIVFVTVRRVP